MFTMARTPRFTVGKIESPGKPTRWRVIIPARFSASGKRQAVYYPTRAAAEKDAAGLRQQYASGKLGLSEILPPAVVSDAQAALAILHASGLNMSLADAARVAVNHATALQRGITIAALFERYRTEAGTARKWRQSTIDTWRKYSRKLIDAMGGMNCAELTPDKLRAWMQEAFPTPTGFNGCHRTLAGAFSWAVKQKLLSESPFPLVELMGQEAQDVDILTPHEARAVLDACRDHRTDPRQVWRDCTDCALPFALLLFAGIRPAELKKLTWADIREDEEDGLCVFVHSKNAKTNTARFVRIRPNLRAFVDAHQGPREGSICPPNWNRKAPLVRKIAGVDGRQDAPRHSFASYALAAGEPLDAVRADMGHVGDSRMIFTNYRAAANKQAAREYWAIYP